MTIVIFSIKYVPFNLTKRYKMANNLKQKLSRLFGKGTQVVQDKEPEKAPVKIEHRENPATNQFYRAHRSYLIHTR